MPNFNSRIEEKLKTYPPNVQDIARKAIETAKRLDAVKLASLLEPKIKSVARKEIKNDFTKD